MHRSSFVDTIRAVARPRVTAGPGGGPVDGVPAKGGRNRAVEGLEVAGVQEGGG
ncbi:hypothetical protein F511_36722 [Dorcoceras hygrometricum]|uniref:Uncharacterized protein n=1 Tax=Dorcoceras hygrometricum TaxID=472368 RepID=A0A2Z7BBK9_9LAMI|nr:hypothetical protein F511_36722 [Dorcoceras hygrometricum]